MQDLGTIASNIASAEQGDTSISQNQPPKKSLFLTNKKAYVDSVLSANKNIDWVQRLHEPSAPSIQIPGEPYKSTHLMADDGNGYVYPTIIRLPNGQLKKLTEDEAYDYAKETNTGIQLPKTQGSWFAANGYKIGTGVLNNINPNGVPFNSPSYTPPKN